MIPPLRLSGGSIATLNPDRPSVESIRISNRHIESIGRATDLPAPTSDEIQIEVPRNALVIPGLVESHAHLRSFALSHHQLDLEEPTDLQAILRLVAEQVTKTPTGDWIRGRGWHPARLETPFPGCEPLDQIAPEHPVILTTHDGHVVWLNTRAMRETEALEPRNTEEIRKLQGTHSPPGIFKEKAADWIRSRLPSPTPEEIRRSIIQTQQHLHRLGITSLVNYEGIRDLSLYRQLDREGELTLRLILNLEAHELEMAPTLDLKSGKGNDQLRIGGLKIYLDGALGSRTAWMLAPYEGTSSRGEVVTSPKKFEELVLKGLQTGLIPTVHAIGDAAVRTCLDCFENIGHLASPSGFLFPPRIEHSQHIAAEDVARFGALGVTASIQPSHLFADLDLIEPALGARSNLAFPWRDLMDSGALLALGSDAPIENPDPRRTLWAAVTRQRTDGFPAGGWHPEQRLTIMEALIAHTSSAALACGLGHRVGQLSPGRLGDLTVFSNNFLAEDAPHRILDSEVLLTVADGRIVYRREDIL